MPRRAWESRPGTALPTPPVRPSPPLCDVVRHGRATTLWHCATHSHTANSPHPRKRTVEPSKGRRATMLPPHKDNAVKLGRRGQSPPSPSVLCGHPRHLQHHPGHCITISFTVGDGETRRCHAEYCAPHDFSSVAPSSQCTYDNQTGDPYTVTLEAAPGRILGTP
jgi:hypothetical protein